MLIILAYCPEISDSSIDESTISFIGMIIKAAFKLLGFPDLDPGHCAGLHALPIGVLEKIFRYLLGGKEFDTVRLVCKAWESCANPLVTAVACPELDDRFLNGLLDKFRNLCSLTVIAPLGCHVAEQLACITSLTVGNHRHPWVADYEHNHQSVAALCQMPWLAGLTLLTKLDRLAALGTVQLGSLGSLQRLDLAVTCGIC